ncbi:hypothetical protein Bca52824_066552 [Brassica carinata]|uniref:Uncharacterized protein n=1 Tax=Brassica carinata TaxID=52824 RepID=A0A8X7UAR7_BRACI|nr:hypothetical protein Bca52824_066552 [Brassica carinata]
MTNRSNVTKLLWSSGIGAPAGVSRRFGLRNSRGHETEDRYTVSHMVATAASCLRPIECGPAPVGPGILGLSKNRSNVQKDHKLKAS